MNSDSGKARKYNEESLLKALANEEGKDEQLALAPESCNLKWMLKADLLELCRSEERDLIQKSKLNWMKLGDVNTKFFHRFLAAEKKRKVYNFCRENCQIPILEKLLSILLVKLLSILLEKLHIIFY